MGHARRFRGRREQRVEVGSRCGQTTTTGGGRGDRETGGRESETRRRPKKRAADGTARPFDGERNRRRLLFRRPPRRGRRPRRRPVPLRRPLGPSRKPTSRTLLGVLRFLLAASCSLAPRRAFLFSADCRPSLGASYLRFVVCRPPSRLRQRPVSRDSRQRPARIAESAVQDRQRPCLAQRVPSNDQSSPVASRLYTFTRAHERGYLWATKKKNRKPP